MPYSESDARALVVEAGHQLLQKGLVARTWGNISARISEEEFIITPSGRSYETLSPSDLVKVKISDLSYEGEMKPSSEKGVHAAAYALRPEIDFIIHTHQLYASAVCAEEKDTPFAPCAAYGLPGTEKLKKKVTDCIAAHPDKTMFLLAKHGTLCLGKSSEEAFSLASELEDRCRALYESRAMDQKKSRLRKAWVDDYAQIVGNGWKKPPEEDLEAVYMIREKNSAAARYVRTAGPLSPFDTLMQRTVYLLKYSKQKNK